jgi:hypothetical protein
MAAVTVAVVSLLVVAAGLIATVAAFVAEIRFSEYVRTRHPTFWKQIQPSIGGMPLAAIFAKRYRSIEDQELHRRGDRARMLLAAMFAIWTVVMGLALLMKALGLDQS